MKKVALHNLGCKVNAYETEAMQEILEQNGYEIVPFEEKADAYIVNTCSVTNMADKKSRQMLHRAKKMNPEAVVIAAGCYVQSAGEELLKDTSVDILIGNNEKVNLPSILENWEKEHKPLYVHDLTREHTYEELTLSHTAGHTRAFMKIQDGCNVRIALFLIQEGESEADGSPTLWRRQDVLPKMVIKRLFLPVFIWIPTERIWKNMRIC